MTDSEKFLDYYNKIDCFLKKEGSYDSYATFSHKVSKSKNRIVIKFKEQLISLGELRNAIVHSPKIGGRIIAEPHLATVEEIENLYLTIANPIKVYPKFSFQVLGAKKEDYINDILVEMRNKSFSQFPVLDDENRVIELINNNTISRWLSSNILDNQIVTDKVQIKDFLNDVEFKKNYKFVSKETTIYEAFDLFIDQINKAGRNLDVLFMTHNGKEEEKLLGLITIEDIAAMI
ncbi:CBS domain-containing protein [Cellulophaga baltica]|uniref:CBS domain-containing protein n=1 Tax=Cellulophaga baltica TaxID=76594 RepID=UPI002147DCD3|nr:CBS domain-containing protein [Cellulophaga baltica]MCR1025774.1 CBS domain-containing protein [Cellulophaga baltica]